MILRLVLSIVLLSLCSACAGERSALLLAPIAHAPTSRERLTDADLKEASRATAASKVLAAIALERVTGRKPDRTRLVQN